MAGHRRAQSNLDAQRKAHLVYSSRWASLRAAGEKPVVINRREHPEQWRAWYSYFRSRQLMMLVEMMENGNERTVPTWWPADFDLDVSMQPDRRVSDG